MDLLTYLTDKGFLLISYSRRGFNISKPAVHFFLEKRLCLVEVLAHIDILRPNRANMNITGLFYFVEVMCESPGDRRGKVCAGLPEHRNRRHPAVF